MTDWPDEQRLARLLRYSVPTGGVPPTFRLTEQPYGTQTVELYARWTFVPLADQPDSDFVAKRLFNDVMHAFWVFVGQEGTKPNAEGISEFSWRLFQSMVGTWANETFPRSTPQSIVKHLQEEAKELQLSVDFPPQPEYWPEEAADILLLLLHLAHKARFDLFTAANMKLEVNQHRNWEQEAGPKGYWKHTSTSIDGVKNRVRDSRNLPPAGGEIL